ncbi:MAG: hypothetical protein OEQ53_11430 [Saprospiraceae bacterium]|nr:hypothetical protein [Saprospiraceae bacterium]
MLSKPIKGISVTSGLVLALSFGASPRMQAQNMDPGLVQFVSKSAMVGDESFIRKNIHQFFDRRMRRQLIHWFEGTIATTEGDIFQVSNIKFNVITHSLYLKFGSAIYILPSSSIYRFVLTMDEQMFTFSKGFSEPFSLSASFSLPKNTPLSQIINLDSITFAELLDYTSVPKKDLQSVELRFQSTNPGASFLLQNRLKQTDGISDLDIQADQARISAGLFFQVLVDGEEVKLVKLLRKQKSFTDSVSPIAQSYSATYDKQTYYLADPDLRLVEIQLNKRSVRQAIAKLGLGERMVDRITSENDLIKVMQGW